MNEIKSQLTQLLDFKKEKEKKGLGSNVQQATIE
jgi:hypothetical protein